ncbi:adenosylhomocysteinase [Dethiobacter alkaliphilus]|uniref:adenosylhomocysteinase n=1 Tax=Dethiobacter alkaliphilus TaxID=427926 RepID=UPI002226D075|nr:adenosylhomocysteinase [Dethiobacter alkaliphilus]MCW3489565.1 adenosylhomocysteinase [Dethiobacter alkaliphilus]
MSTIRNQSLAPEGKLKINWVKEHMPVLNELAREFRETKPFAGLRVAICLHLEAKTAYMAKVVQESGAQVTITGSNPLSTQDDVAAALVEDGLTVHSWYNATDEEYEDHLHKTMQSEPHLIIDDGGDLVAMLHSQYPQMIDNVRGGAEETTTGLIRLRAMAADGELKIPMMAVNDAFCKYLFDNRYGTGQSVWDGIMRATNLVVAGKTVVVIGYGWCGKGVAMRARGLGARVIVCEVDPVKAVEAIMDGNSVMPMLDAAAEGNIFVTVTGCRDAITKEHYENMKDGAILCNAGHFDLEIDKGPLEELAENKRLARKNVEAYEFNGKTIYLIAEGRLVNLAAADGHPAEIMDMSFALQVEALHYLNSNHGKLPNDVLTLPQAVDDKVARRKLQAMGVSIDTLSKAQECYLTSWKAE